MSGECEKAKSVGVVIKFFDVCSAELEKLKRDWQEGRCGHKYKSFVLGQERGKRAYLITFEYQLGLGEDPKDYIQKRGRKLEKRFGKDAFSWTIFTPI